ncbi:MAG: dephospho-CoA kinase [Acidobacteria bacterium]|nr:dephospho-CoA kinase [Acidobacteriota bacterium]
MLRVGLTGGIACGKSHVLARLGAAGLRTLDLDRIAHEVMAPGGGAYEDVVAAFGPGILAADGTVDRKALGHIAFGDAAARARLNAIVHPRVREEEARRADAYAADAGAVFVTDAALLVESGGHLRFDRLVVVHCSEAEQLRRLMARDSLDEAAARARIAAQLPLAEKRRFAHFDVDTGGSVEATSAEADRLAAVLRKLAASRRTGTRVALERAVGAIVHGPSRGPRGLDPRVLLTEIAGAGGIEMERVARLLAPPHEGPWYRAARAREPGPPPATLAAPAVLWSLARSGPDPDFVCAAMASLARLTHREPAAVADAVLFALALEASFGAGGWASAAQPPEAWRDRAAAWGGGRPSGRLDPVFGAAAQHASSPAAARTACALGGGDPDLAGILVGTAVGAPPSAAPGGLVADLERLLR